MARPLRTLLPPGGFQNVVGHAMAALDVGLDALKAVARAVPGDRVHERAVPGLPSVVGTLRAVGERESAWVHRAVGGVPTPPPPEDRADLDAWFGWLDAVRTVTLMVLRPLQERDLERLVDLPEVDAPTTIRRALSELLEHQAHRRGEIAALSALLGRRAATGASPEYS
jgi:uncharacterized damage-inducible protein DinB